MSHVDTFLEVLDGLGVQWSRTDTDHFRATLAEVLDPPCVGVPLPFDGLSLERVNVSMDPSPRAIKAAQTGVTPVHLAVAAYGSLVLKTGTDATDAVSLFPEHHVAVLQASDIVPDLGAALEHLGSLLRNRSVSAILATGPSATADMGALVKGAHGPKFVTVVVVDDR